MIRSIALALVASGVLCAGPAFAQVLVYPRVTSYYAPAVAAPVVASPAVTVAPAPVTTYYAPSVVAPVTTYYAPSVAVAPAVPVTTYRAVVTNSFYAPARTTALYAPAAPITTAYYAPAVTPVTSYYAPAAAVAVPTPLIAARPVTVGRSAYGTLRAYVPGQPVRNSLRYLVP